MSGNVFDRDRLMSHKYMEEPLKILGSSGDAGWKRFLVPWGLQKVTLVHLAAFIGNLQMLERAVDHGVDLNAEDWFKRCALHHAAFQGHVDVVTWLLDQPCAHYQHLLPNSDGNMPLHEAIEGLQYDSSRTLPEFNSRNVAVVQLLVDKGADVNVSDVLGRPPLLQVGRVFWRNRDPKAAIWYQKVVKILVSSSASVNVEPDCWGFTSLHYAVLLGSSEATWELLSHGASIMECGSESIPPLHLAAASKHHEILCIFLEELDPSLIDVQNLLGMTPLCLAAKKGHLKNFRVLVDRGGNLLTKNFEGMTVFDVLFADCANPVAYLTDVLDSRILYIDGTTVSLDFKVLVPPDRPQMEIISALISAVPNMEEMTILQHPLLETFLRLKWSNFRYFYFVLFALHVCFLLSLFWYAVLLVRRSVYSDMARRTIFPWASILLSHNVLQLLTTPRHYIRQFEYWLSMTCETMSIVVAITNELIPEITRQLDPWLLNSVSVVILLAGIQMMLIICRFPASGYYTLMFFAVLKNVLKVFLAFVWLIVSFAFSFLILFLGENQFYDPWLATVKTVVMMTGEYDYDDLFTATSKDNSTVNYLNSSNTLLPLTRRIIFLLFVMLANIVLMNLITALAVTDVQELVKKGKLLRLMKQAEFVAYFERMLTYWISARHRVPNCLKKMFEMEIDDHIFLSRPWVRRGHRRRDRCISEKLMKKLLALGDKNRDSDEKSQEDAALKEPEEDVTETICDLQKQIRELEQKKKFTITINDLLQFSRHQIRRRRNHRRNLKKKNLRNPSKIA